MRVLVASVLPFALLSACSSKPKLESCSAPFVCFFDESGTTTGKFMEVTEGWQFLGASKGAVYVTNARRDDVAYIRFSNGETACVPPRSDRDLSDPGTPDAIRIDPAKSC
jgi:hypothetical protein